MANIVVRYLSNMLDSQNTYTNQIKKFLSWKQKRLQLKK